MLTNYDIDLIRKMLEEQRKSLIEDISGAVVARISEMMAEAGISNATMSQARAFELYGRRTVENWVRRGWITAHSDGPRRRKRYSTAELARVEKNNNIKERNKV